MKRYDKYKQSGVKWIGEIPEHWEVRRIKYLIREKISDGPHESPEFIDFGVPFISVDGIQNGELVFEGCRYISESDHAKFRRKTIVEKNDILMGKAASIGKIARVKVNFDFNVWSPLAIIKPNERINNTYFEFYLKSTLSQYQIETLSTSNTQKNISMDDIPKIIVTLPPQNEQTFIAKYLEDKTEQIDKLIENKQKLIELLKEERTAIINEAVSGEGKNWERKKLKWFFKLSRGFDLSSNNFKDGDISVYGSNGCIGYHNEATTKGPGITVGRSGSVGEVNIIEKDFWAHNTCLFVYENFGNNWNYIFYFLKNFDLKSLSSGSVVGTLNRNYIHDEIIYFPSLQDQSQIVNHIQTETQRLDNTISKIEKEIELMKEYKTALISEAVTGKIKVI